MSRFSRRVPTFQDVFPSSDASFVQPTDVSEVVGLTHPFLPAGARFQEATFLALTGGLGVSNLSFLPVPVGKFWYVPWWDVQHTDATGRNIRFQVVEPGANQIVTVHSTNQDGDGAGLDGGDTPVGLPRPILIPPRWNAFMSFDGMGAGAFMTTHLMRVEYPLAEDPPPY